MAEKRKELQGKERTSCVSFEAVERLAMVFCEQPGKGFCRGEVSLEKANPVIFM